MAFAKISQFVLDRVGFYIGLYSTEYTTPTEDGQYPDGYIEGLKSIAKKAESESLVEFINSVIDLTDEYDFDDEFITKVTELYNNLVYEYYTLQISESITEEEQQGVDTFYKNVYDITNELMEEKPEE